MSTVEPPCEDRPEWCETDEWVVPTPILKPGDRVAVRDGDTTFNFTIPAHAITQEPDMTSPTQRRHDELVALLTEIRDRLPEPHRGAPDLSTAIANLADVGIKVPPPAPADDLIDDATNARYEREDAEARQDDLPGEPVEPGDLRAGDRVAFTWEGGRISGTLVSALYGAVLRSDAPDSGGLYPSIVFRGEWWCGGISDVRLIERDTREDSDERIRVYVEMVERAEKAEAERDEFRDACNSWQSAAQEAEYLSEKFRAERDEFNGFWKDALADVRKARDERDDAIARAESWRDANSGILAERDAALDERDEWKAKHAALRADVDRLQREHKALPAMWDFVDALGHDAARTPQPDPDTVTLPRAVASLLAEAWEHQSDRGEDDESVTRVARAALGWGDSDE